MGLGLAFIPVQPGDSFRHLSRTANSPINTLTSARGSRETIETIQRGVFAGLSNEHKEASLWVERSSTVQTLAARAQEKGFY